MDKTEVNSRDNTGTKTTKSGQKKEKPEFHSGRRLQLAVKLTGKRIKDIAEKLGDNPDTISSWLKPSRKIPANRIPQIAAFFGVEEHLFSDHLEITPEEVKNKIVPNPSKEQIETYPDPPFSHLNREFPWEQVLSNANDEVEYHFYKGCKCNEEHQLDQAYFNLSKAIGLDMLNPQMLSEAFYERGRSWYKKGHLKEAFEDYLTSLKRNPDPEWFAIAGDLVYLDKPFRSLRFPWYSTDEASQKIQDFNLLEKDLPNNAMVYYLRGREELAVEVYDAALTDLNRAIELEEDSVHIDDFYGARGYVFYHQESYENAVVDFTRVIEKGGNLDPMVVYFRALAYEKQNRLTDALEDIKRCLEADPNQSLFLEKFRTLQDLS